jgi:two-component system, OmpR family, phosphate regulon sensor histidine kinase PhoR
MFQRNSPSFISFIISIFTFVITFITSYIVYGSVPYSAIVAFILALIIGLTVYYYVTQILDKKINTIYKLINKTKAGKKEQFYINNLLPRPTLDELGKDVQTWADKNAAEFELLEKNEKYRKEFLQNLSHELKTPLFAMQGYIETLIDGAKNDPTVVDKYLQNTSNNIERLTALVKDIDIISKLESQMQPIIKTSFVINDLLEQCILDFEKIAADKNVKILIHNDAIKNVKVVADKLKIKQVLDNLIENAIKYSKPNSIVKLNIEILNETTIIIEISDNGYGIAQEHLDRIFERFYRTDMARSRNIGGSGLGLSICKHIIEAHDQNIHVRSNINIGTTFRFSLEKG